MIRFFADYLLIIVLGISAVVLLYDGVRKGVRARYPQLILSGLSALLIAKLMSLAYQPTAERPFVSQGVAPGAAFIDNPGFPSDHALLGVAAVWGVYALTGRRKLSLVLAVAVVAMMIARVLALVHTPVDIIGGAVAASLGALWYLQDRRNKA